MTRIIGMIYRIPVTNIIGDKGNGYYASAYYIYNIMLLISSYSLPLAISKVVSARLSNRQYRNASKVFRGGLIFACITGGTAGLVVLFGADKLAEFLKEPLSAIALRIFAPTLLIVAVMGVFRGYFQGMGNMVPTAVSQIIEQIINAVISIVAAKSLFDYGKRRRRFSGMRICPMPTELREARSGPASEPLQRLFFRSWSIRASVWKKQRSGVSIPVRQSFC